MDNGSEKIKGLTRDEWTATYRPGIQEFAGQRFSFAREGRSIRIAFGNLGPWIDETTRQPVYSYAVTMSDDMAVEMAMKILHLYGAPAVAAQSPETPTSK